MLHKCGLLRPDVENLIPYASKIYNTEEIGLERVSEGFKQTFARPCPVHFIGVWDTVGSLVLSAGRRFHDTILNPEVANAYHAVSIDERRKDFPVSLWDESEVFAGQTIEQVWFAGVHSDVGGWFEERGLPNITLQWMLGKALGCGMKLDEKALASYTPDPHCKFHESFQGFWKFRRSRRRKIPVGASIHESVFKRIGRKSNKYAPNNLPKGYQVVS